MLEGTAAWIAVIAILAVILFAFLGIRRLLKKWAQEREAKRAEMLALVERGGGGAVDKEGVALLVRAVQEGFEDVVDRALAQGAEVNRTGPDGATALHDAAFRGSAAVARRLLDAGARPDPADASGCTPLWVAALNGHVLVVDLLLAQGADINLKAAPCGGAWGAVFAPSTTGVTPLMVAAMMGRSGVVERLLQEGAAPGIVSDEGLTAWNYAEQNLGRNMDAYVERNVALKNVVLMLECAEKGLPFRPVVRRETGSEDQVNPDEGGDGDL